jgi:hypothetical protein
MLGRDKVPEAIEFGDAISKQKNKLFGTRDD